MVKKTNKNNANKINRNSINNTSQHLSNEPTFTPKNYNNDELILSLSDAYENKRARQVTEWERAQRRNISQAV